MKTSPPTPPPAPRVSRARPAPRARHGLARALALALLVATALGVRPTRSLAGSWSLVAFEGDGRAHVVVEADGADAAEVPAAFEAFTRVVYATQASTFARGLWLRVTFRVPGTERNAVLVLDLDRARAAEGWEGGRLDRLVARYYEVAAGGGPVLFDGEAEEGALQSDGIAVDGELVGFRLAGSLRFVDPGPDGLVGSEDDRNRTVDAALESDPAPESVRAGTGGLTGLPSDPLCDATVCWVDPGYGYYQEIYVPVGCEAESYDPATDEQVSGGCDGGDSEGGGCEGDTYDSDDGDGCGSDGWSQGSDDAGQGCEGESGTDAGGGCDSGSGSGCGDAGGCQGDTY